MSVAPLSLVASKTPFDSGMRYAKLYWTWFDASCCPSPWCTEQLSCRSLGCILQERVAAAQVVLTSRMLAAVRTRSALKLLTPTACVRPCWAQRARPSTKASLDKACVKKPGQ